MPTKVSPFRAICNNRCHLYIGTAPATHAKFSYRVAMSRENQAKKKGSKRINRPGSPDEDDLDLDANPIQSQVPPSPPVLSNSPLPSFIQAAVRPAVAPVATTIPFARAFTIPEKCLGHEWQLSGRQAKDRKFSMRGLTPDMEQKSAELAGIAGSVVLMIQHMQLLCICKIGGEVTNQNQAKITSWMHDIGKSGRMCLERAYNKINSATEDELATFLDTEEPDFDF